MKIGSVATRNCVATTILAAAMALVAIACDDAGIFLGPAGDAWMATDPVQCLGNPWEQDWLDDHGGDYGAYPQDPDSQEAIIVEYYAGIGIEVREVVSIVTHPATCDACSCPRGDTLYLRVPFRDVDDLLRLGYRRQSPRPFG